MNISVKFYCSLKWLSRVISESPHKKEIQVPQGMSVTGLLLDPYQDGNLKDEIVDVLTNPNIYWSAYNVLFPGEQVVASSFEPLLHCLGKKGGYVVEDGDIIVSDSMLTQTEPFREKSHLALLDALMIQYAIKIITMQAIARSVRKISTFNVSKELPNKIELDLLITVWLNKVSEAVCNTRSKEIDILMHEPDPRQRRRNKAMVMQSGDNPVIPPILGDLYSGISDGQSVAALLLHYLPHVCEWKNFNFSGERSLSREKILENFQSICGYCNNHLSAPGFHLSPIDLVQWGSSGLLNTNILVLFAHLFYCFEVKSSAKKLIRQQSSHASISSVPVNTHKSLQSSSDGAINKMSIPAVSREKFFPPITTLHSRSTEILPPPAPLLKHKLVKFGPINPKIHENLNSTDRSSLQVRNLKSRTNSISSSASDSRVFEAPLRTSLNATQLSALSAFKKENRPLTKGIHSQSSPLIQTQLPPIQSTPVNITNTPSSSKLISASSDNLNIQEQMSQIQNRASVSRQHESFGTTDSTDGWSTSSDHTYHNVNSSSTVTNSKTNEYDNSGGGQNGSQLLNTGSPQNDLEFEVQVHESFTLNKQHTLATATKAGLPVISNAQKVELPVDDKGIPESQPEVMSTISISDHNPTVIPTTNGLGELRHSGEAILLTDMLQLHHSAWIYASPAHKMPVPSSIQKFKISLMPVLTSIQSQDADMEREVLVNQLKISHSGISSKAISSSSGPVSDNTSIDLASKAIDDGDLQASASLSSDTHEHSKKNDGKEATASDKQEQDEVIVEKPPPHIIKLNPVGVDIQKSLPRTKYHPLHERPSSPIVHRGQQTYIVHHKPEVNNEGSESNGIQQNPHTSPPQVPSSQATQAPSTNFIEIIQPNPWVSPLHQAPKGVDIKGKGELVRSRIVQRDKARKLAAEHRKNRTREVPKEDNVTVLDPTSKIKQNSDTLHFQLSAVHATEKRETAVPSDSSLSEHHVGHVYSGPTCYVQPKAKSNLKIIRNAISFVCLAGDVHLSFKNKILAELEKTPATHVLILFRDTLGYKFRGVYSYYSGERSVMRICGTGPKEIKEIMISHLYKYNSGQREFQEIPSRTLSYSVDALTIKPQYWSKQRPH